MVHGQGSRPRPGDVQTAVSQGIAYRDEYEATGDSALLDRSVRVLDIAVAAARQEATKLLYAALSELGTSLRLRVRIRSGPDRKNDLAAAVAAHEEAYLLVPRSSPHRAGMAGNLAGTLRQRWAAIGDPADLDRAVQLYREAAAAVPPGIPYVADMLTNLANGLSDRFDYRGNRSDLDEAVRAALGGVQASAADSPRLPNRLAIAAGLLLERGKLLGDRAEISKALELARRARDLTPPERPEYLGRLSTLTFALIVWYVASGDLAALDQALQLCWDGLNRARGHPPEALLMNLSAAYRLRYDVYQQPEDLRNALDVILTVLGRFVTAPTPRRASLLESAAMLHRLQADMTQDPGELAAAADALEEARTIWPSNSAGYALATGQLGQLMYHRWRDFGGDDLATLDEAVHLQETALAAMQPSGTDWARCCYVLSSTLADRGFVTGRSASVS
jgi:tetratricopeptide (TPR) repeat protein